MAKLNIKFTNIVDVGPDADKAACYMWNLSHLLRYVSVASTYSKYNIERLATCDSALAAQLALLPDVTVTDHTILDMPLIGASIWTDRKWDWSRIRVSRQNLAYDRSAYPEHVWLADSFRGELRLPLTSVGFEASLRDWLTDNPQLCSKWFSAEHLAVFPCGDDRVHIRKSKDGHCHHNIDRLVEWTCGRILGDAGGTPMAVVSFFHND